MQADLTDALTRAFFEEWSRVGYAALRLECVAKNAGAGKAALYRRWFSKLGRATDPRQPLQQIELGRGEIEPPPGARCRPRLPAAASRRKPPQAAAYVGQQH